MSDEDALRPLDYAAGAGNDALIKLLVTAGADPSLGGREGRTPVHWAAYNGNGKALRMLVALGASPTVGDSKGRTVSHLAAQSGSKRGSSQCGAGRQRHSCAFGTRVSSSQW